MKIFYAKIVYLYYNVTYIWRALEVDENIVI